MGMMDIMSLPISMAGQQMTNMQQADMMNQQMQFQERMSSTSYQRAAQDMKAAGLNPMMMTGGGMNASSPAGSPASPMVKSGLDADAVQKAVSTALGMKTTEAQVKNIEANTNKADAETITELQKPGLIDSQTALHRAGERVETETEHRMKELRPVYTSEAIRASNENALHSATRRVLDQAAYGGAAVSKTLRPVSDFIGSAGGLHRMLLNSRRDARQAFD
ncbi:MAG: DNA pilot protein [Microvirus sp.]|nr:MAG: DNA pilot protein [Microvirus sp.]